MTEREPARFDPGWWMLRVSGRVVGIFFTEEEARRASYSSLPGADVTIRPGRD